jgi:hypothetical protein
VLINVILFGNTIFAEVIKVKKRSSKVAGVPMKRGETWRQTHGETPYEDGSKYQVIRL